MQVFNFSRVGLTAAQEVIERNKWRNALAFHANTSIMDLSYDGWFFRNDLAGVGKVVNYSKPDYVTFDIESKSSAWRSRLPVSCL